MLKTKIAVFVSGGGTNLQALIDAQNAGIIASGEIALVIANNADAYAIQRAKNHGIPYEVILKKECGSQEAGKCDGNLDGCQELCRFSCQFE